MNVDVTVCTYNSQRYLDQCLSSIEREVPVSKLLVVDNFSTDKTEEIALRHDAVFVKSDGSLAESRQLSFNLTETPLFVNVDSDVVLTTGWFRKLLPYLESDVGACWGVALNMNPIQHRHYQEAMYRFKSPSLYNLIVLGNMICRRKAVQGLTFPDDFKRGAVAGEDYYIKRFIEKRGYRTLTAPIYVEHYCNPPPLGLKTYWMGASTRLTQRKGLIPILQQIFLSIPQAAYVSVLTKDPLIYGYWLRYRFETLMGWLHWSKYYNFRRSV